MKSLLFANHKILNLFWQQSWFNLAHSKFFQVDWYTVSTHIGCEHSLQTMKGIATCSIYIIPNAEIFSAGCKQNCANNEKYTFCEILQFLYSCEIFCIEIKICLSVKIGVKTSILYHLDNLHDSLETKHLIQIFSTARQNQYWWCLNFVLHEVEESTEKV